MRAIIHVSLLLGLIAFAGGELVADAQPRGRGKIYGTWTSTTGNVFEIPRSRGLSFDMIVTYKGTNRQGLLRGRWVPGMVGTQFTFVWQGRQTTGTFTRGRIRLVVSGGGISWWNRHYARSRSMRAAGVWRSTSGNTFTVPARRGNFNIIMTSPRGAKQLYQAYWVSGMEGVQFRYGAGPNRATYNTVTFNARTGQLRLVSGGKAYYWRRVR